MSSQDQLPQKKSRAYSTVAPTVQPYRIPTEMVSDKKNMMTMLHESKASSVENYFFKTKVNSNNDTQRKVQFRKSPKPKIQNKLHLDLPTEKKVSVQKYVGQEKHFEQTVGQFFAQIFKSCLAPERAQSFEQCEYCNHRYSKEDEEYKKRQEQELAKEMSLPYVSYRRLIEREKQPIQVFYQQITNEPIRNNRWESTQSQFKHL